MPTLDLNLKMGVVFKSPIQSQMSHQSYKFKKGKK